MRAIVANVTIALIAMGTDVPRDSELIACVLSSDVLKFTSMADDRW